MPRALRRKIGYLRKIIKQMPLPADAANGYERLFAEIEAASQTRHDLIHGVVVEHVEYSGEIKMVRLGRDKDNLMKRDFIMTTTEILEAALAAQRLGGKTLYWATELQKLVAK